MIKAQPLVTVNILSFNRRNELRNTLTKVFEQDYKNIEVIVVDNASTDGSSKMVTEEFPEVKLIKMEKNIGIAGWNEGFCAAKGEYVLVLDDDSHPLPGTIISGIQAMRQDDSNGIVAFKVYNSIFRKYESFFIDDEPYSFVGCGALIKQELVKRIGGYNVFYFFCTRTSWIFLRRLLTQVTKLYLVKGLYTQS